MFCLGTDYHILYSVFSSGADVINNCLKQTDRLGGLILQFSVAFPISLHSVNNHSIKFNTKKQMGQWFRNVEHRADY